MNINIDLSNPDAWDDTELIESYERAIGSYLVCFALQAPSSMHAQ